MGITNFSTGLLSQGVPVLGGQGLLTQGKNIFVKPRTGNDGADGSSVEAAVKTLTRALALATADQNDTVYLFAESNTAGSTSDPQSATLDWNKDLVHLVGVAAPVKFSQRARINQVSTATGVSPLVKVSADGCVFRNLQIFHGVADATSLVAVEVTGERNVFDNVHFAGIGNATMVAANAASLKIDGGSENYFHQCVIGLDTITRDETIKGEIWFDGGATRNWFDDCLIQGFISNAGYQHVTVEDGTAIDRWTMFRRCLFLSKSVNKTITQTTVFDIAAGISQGAIVLYDSAAFSDGGAVDWDSNNRGIIWNNTAAAAASAAGGIFTNQ